MSPETWLARADAMVADGRFLDAIDTLSEANRSLSNPTLEERLVDLRRQAFTEVKDAVGRSSWPPDHPDPFPGQRGAVEVSAREVTPAIIGGAIQHHGCLVVRGLMGQPSTDRLVRVVEQALASQMAWTEGAPRSQTTPWYAPWEAPYAPGADEVRHKGLPVDPDRVFLADSPRAMFEVTEAFRTAGIDRLVGGYLGDRPVMTEKKWLLWKMTRRADVFAFHQEVSVFNSGDDGLPAARLKAPLRALNVWLALSRCGTTSPGFQFYPVRIDRAVPPDQLFGLTPAALAPVIEDTEVAAPLFEPGDAVLFDEFLLHRTKSDASMSEARYSLESWMFAPVGHPERDSQSPIVL